MDNDGDEDVLLAGRNNDGERISKLYLNGGDGSFVLETGTIFDGVESSSIAFSDVDNDGDEDVLITGLNVEGDRISKLYINAGEGIFTLMDVTPFIGVSSGQVAFADMDGDLDSDVIITGSSGSERISKLYLNEGAGVFSEVNDTPFEGVYRSSIATADVDGDCDMDVFIAGRVSINSDELIAQLYLNESEPITTGIVSVSVNWNEQCLSRSGLLSIYESGSEDLLYSEEVQISADGSFEVNCLPLGTFDFYLKMEGFLQKSLTNIAVTNETNELQYGDLTAGDISGDNAITVPDFSIFSGAYGSSEGGEAYNYLADFNCDGIINIIDYSQFSSNYGITGDEP